MLKCSPVEMRKNLEVVQQFSKHGIDFVAVPVRDQDHKNELISLGANILEDFAKAAEDNK